MDILLINYIFAILSTCLIKIVRSFLLLTYASFHHISVKKMHYLDNSNNISSVNFNDTVTYIYLIHAALFQILT